MYEAYATQRSGFAGELWRSIEGVYAEILAHPFLRGLTDEACKDLNLVQRDRVANAFITTSRYEWMFWDAAWRLEEWPVG